jgi:hypothetical protein
MAKQALGVREQSAAPEARTSGGRGAASACFSQRWWQIDIGWYVIRGLHALGLNQCAPGQALKRVAIFGS